MSITEFFAEIERLRNSSAGWNHEVGRARYTAIVGDLYKLTVDQRSWQVEQLDTRTIIQPWKPCDHVVQGRIEACDFLRAYLVSLAEHQHAE